MKNPSMPRRHYSIFEQEESTDNSQYPSCGCIFCSNHPSPLWSFNRAAAWTAIKTVMATAGIEGAQANPKGLRHSFAIFH